MNSRPLRATRLALAACSVVVLLGAPAPPPPPPVLEIVYSGNRRSQLEPCGCHSNMQGGMQYEASYIRSLRAKGAPLLLLDAGGFVGSVPTPSQFLRTRYLLKSMGSMGYRILNVARPDASYGLDFLKEMQKELGFEYVSATMLDPQTRRPLFKPYVICEFPGPNKDQPFRVAVTGFGLPDSPAPEAILDLPASAGVAEGAPATSPTLVLRFPTAGTPPAPAAARAPGAATPTPRVSPTPSIRLRGSFLMAPDHTEAMARTTPTPHPYREEFKRLLQERQKAEELARQQLVRHTPTGLAESETTFNAAVPQASASAPATQPASSPATAPDPPGVPAADPVSQPAPASVPASRPASAPASAPASGPAGREASKAAKSSEKIEAPRPRGKEFVAADPVATLSKLVPALRRQADFVVVLANYPETNAVAVLDKVPGIDLLITGFGAVASTAPKKHGTATTLNAGYDGKTIGKVDVSSASGPREEGAGRHAVKGQTIPINTTLKADPAVDKILAEYKEQTKKIAPAPALVTAYTLAGAEGCRSCHPSEYAQWIATPHARAFETLTQKNQDSNPECIRCHVTSYNQDNGFRDIRTTPQFANVQCEVCHGPSLRHVRFTRLAEQMTTLKEPQRRLIEAEIARNRPKKTPEEKVCLGCHTPPNDDHFVYAVKIEKVRHQSGQAATQPVSASRPASASRPVAPSPPVAARPAAGTPLLGLPSPPAFLAPAVSPGRMAPAWPPTPPTGGTPRLRMTPLAPQTPLAQRPLAPATR